ncbi:hypothetical protein [Streptomyces prunicolor]|uniref:hypothetical protein n=1 Tax=Streptomyces prunicolor TaxID=67348 RepID=UPI003408B93D
MELSHLVEALRAEALDVALTDDGQIVVNLPSSRDQLILGPSRGGTEPRLFWQSRTFLGTRTNECGYLEWAATPEPVVGAILGYARAPGLTGHPRSSTTRHRLRLRFRFRRTTIPERRTAGPTSP